MKIKKLINHYEELEVLEKALEAEFTKFKSKYESIKPGPIYMKAIIKAIDNNQKLPEIDCNLYLSKELFQLTGKYQDFKLSHQVREFPKNIIKYGRRQIDEKELELECWRFYKRFKKVRKYYELKEIKPFYVQFLMLTGFEFQKIK